MFSKLRNFGEWFFNATTAGIVTKILMSIISACVGIILIIEGLHIIFPHLPY